MRASENDPAPVLRAIIAVNSTSGASLARSFRSEDFESAPENRDVGPGALRSDDGAILALGSQSVLVDVRIPAAITFIDGGGPSVRTLEETVDRKQWGQTERSPISVNGNE